MANNWTRGAAHRHTTAPISVLGLHPVARELLLISRPSEGRRLSCPEDTVVIQSFHARTKQLHSWRLPSFSTSRFSMLERNPETCGSVV